MPFSHRSLKPAVQPFAGRIGGNQELVLDRDDPENAELLRRIPDAAPLMAFKDGFDLRGFWDVGLWKFGFVECIGTMMHSFVTVWASIHPNSAAVPATTPAGVFSTATFLGPLVGGICNWLSLTLFIFTFANVSGAHLNPTITFGTFFARLISFPRLVIYVGGQTLGGALAGWMLRTAQGSRSFAVGGCSIDTELVPVKEAFVLEFIYSLILIFLSFGVALDPRQGKIYGAALSPFLVGMVLGVLSWTSSFSRIGYAGASMNPARCFGVYVATSFPGYHWIHWVGPIVSSVGHGIAYFFVPPWGAVERLALLNRKYHE